MEAWLAAPSIWGEAKGVSSTVMAVPEKVSLLIADSDFNCTDSFGLCRDVFECGRREVFNYCWKIFPNNCATRRWK